MFSIPAIGANVASRIENMMLRGETAPKAKEASLFSFGGNEDNLVESSFDFDDIALAPEYKAASYTNFTRTAGNGLVDFDARQGEIGDCGLLATIRALRNSEGGQNALKDVMSYDAEFGVWSFKFNTADFKGEEPLAPITITQAEVDKAIEDRHVSKGDDDVSAIELAVEKYLTYTGASTVNDDVNSKDKFVRQIAGMQNRSRANRMALGEQNRGYLDGVSPYIGYLFTGSIPKLASVLGENKMGVTPEEALNNFNKTTDMLVFSQIQPNGTVTNGKGDETSNPFITIGDDQVLGNHAYTVCEVNGDTVTLRESNNPSETITVTKKELLECTGKNSFYYYSYPLPEETAKAA